MAELLKKVIQKSKAGNGRPPAKSWAERTEAEDNPPIKAKPLSRRLSPSSISRSSSPPTASRSVSPDPVRSHQTRKGNLVNFLRGHAVATFFDNNQVPSSNTTSRKRGRPAYKLLKRMKRKEADGWRTERCSLRGLCEYFDAQVSPANIFQFICLIL